MSTFAQEILKKVGLHEAGEETENQDKPLLNGYRKLPDIYRCEEQRNKLIRLVCRHPTEWNDTPKKGEVLKLNDAQKKQIKTLSWWDKANSVKDLPEPQNVWHFHPAGFVGNLMGCIDIDLFIKEYKLAHHELIGWYEKNRQTKKYEKLKIKVLNKASEDNLRRLIKGLIKYYSSTSYKQCSITRLSYILATIRLEAYQFKTQEFFGLTAEKISYARTEIDYGCGKTARRASEAKLNGCKNDGDGYKYRGRGFVQVTWKINLMG